MSDMDDPPRLDWETHHNLADSAAVGTDTLAWSRVEAALEQLIWQCIGSADRGHVVTSQLHNVARADLLHALAAMLEPNPTILERVEDALAAFDILRLNRNVIVHCVDLRPSHHDRNILKIQRHKKTLRMEEPEVYYLKRERLADMIDEMGSLEDFMLTARECMDKRSGTSKLLSQVYNCPLTYEHSQMTS